MISNGSTWTCSSSIAGSNWIRRKEAWQAEMGNSILAKPLQSIPVLTQIPEIPILAMFQSIMKLILWGYENFTFLLNNITPNCFWNWGRPCQNLEGNAVLSFWFIMWWGVFLLNGNFKGNLCQKNVLQNLWWFYMNLTLIPPKWQKCSCHLVSEIWHSLWFKQLPCEKLVKTSSQWNCLNHSFTRLCYYLHN